MIVAHIAVETWQLMDWIQLVATGGVSLALIVFFVTFFDRRVWPFIIKRIEQNDERHRIETEKFLSALGDLAKSHAAASEARDRMHTAESEARDRVQAAQNAAITNLADAIKALQQVRGRQ